MQNQNAGTPGEGNNSTVKLTLETLIDFTADQLTSVDMADIAETVKTFSAEWDRHNAAIKNHKVEARRPIRQLGKLVAIGENRYSVELGKGDTTRTFRDWLLDVTGTDMAKLPRRVHSANRVYQKLVIAGHLDETDYDRLAVDWIDVASTVIGLLPKTEKGTDYESADAKELLRILERADAEKAKTELETLRDRLQGKKTENVSGQKLTLDATSSETILARICRENLPGKNGGEVAGVLLVCTALHGAVKTADKMPLAVSKNLLLAIRGFLADFPASVVAAVDGETTPNPTPGNPAGTVEEWIGKHFPNNADNDNLRKWVAHFQEKSDAKRLPETAAELMAHMQAYTPADTGRKGRKAKAEPVVA